jgi:hypothetical protein
MLKERVLNPSKKDFIHGTMFNLVFLGKDAVLYDSDWGDPIIYASKGTVRGNFKNPKLFSALIDQNDGSSYLEKIITLYVYRMQGNGEIKKIGTPLTGKAVDIKVPNY